MYNLIKNCSCSRVESSPLPYGSLCIISAAERTARVQMTRIVLPGMKERRKGAIVNIGSAAATVAPSGPLYCVYAGTKVSHGDPSHANKAASCCH